MSSRKMDALERLGSWGMQRPDVDADGYPIDDWDDDTTGQPDTHDTSITVTVDNLVELTVAELWPDGDPPTPVTAADVVSALYRAGDGSLFAGLSEHGALAELDVTVTVDAPNPHHTQADALFPEHAPAARVRTEAHEVAR